jgi:rubrerythrin
MLEEQEKTLEALRTAIAMEIDGRECYLQAAKESNNEVGSKLLTSLAQSEEEHQRRFEEIYESIRKQRSWPEVSLDPGQRKQLRQLMEQTCELVGIDVQSNATELNALKTSIEKEKQSYDFYETQRQNAKYKAERDFYASLVAEEKEHELLLLDYYEYLVDPAGYFVKTEHPSLDGG